MKILYTKCNSERAKEFQLQTTIFEVDGKKFVKKKALTKEAIAHIDNMKQNREALEGSILDKNLLLVPVVESSKDSITFEFINGESFDKRLKRVAYDSKEVKEMIQEYQNLLLNGFKTTKFDHTLMVTDKFKEIFGEFNYDQLDGESCYDGICNLDMIPSNLIYKDSKIYIIDYEWTFSLTLPINFILYRVALQLEETFKDEIFKEKKNLLLFHKMERNFIDNSVMKNSIYTYRHKYMKRNLQLSKYIEEIENKNNILENTVKKLNKDLNYARSIIDLRDKQIESLRLKNRFKKLLNRFNLTQERVEDPFDPNYELPIKISNPYNYVEPIICKDTKEQINSFLKKPIISIIMPVYNVDPKWLKKSIESVRKQWYPHWELCIVDDCSTNIKTKEYLKSITNPKIKIKFLDKNLNISGASNEALKMASGDYISLLDNDDELTPNALYEMVKEINNSDADFIYSDEDFIDTKGVCSNPHYKPDFSPDLLLSHNYITHLTCFKKELLDSVGWFKSKFDGAQDYELFLRLTEKANKISHVPKVLYHWRMIEGSTSANSKAKPEALKRGKILLEKTLERRGVDALVETVDEDHYFRVKYTIKNNPLISIIIPFKDQPALLRTCLTTILQYTTYQNYEIIGISNNSKENETFELMEEFEQIDPRIKFYEYNIPFNYSNINNYAVKNFANGEHILLLNNDIEIIESSWLDAMVEHSQREGIGCVGAKLYYPNDTIQHAGIIIGLGGYAGHSHKHYPRDNPGYFNRLNAIQNISAVTGACLMVKKSIYQEVNGMDEVKFKVAYNDVDFCLRVREKGYLNIFTPYAELYHHESISRGYETTPEKIARFQKEKDALFERYKEIITNGDPYYNPNLCHDREDFSICPTE